MTPLALRILNDMMRPIHKRAFRDHDGLLPHLRQEFHPFEVTQIIEPLVKPLFLEMLKAEFPTVAWSFLPAERTWFEYRDNEGGRVGCMLVDKGGWADVYVVSTNGFSGVYIGRVALMDTLAKLDPSLGWRNVEHEVFKRVPVYYEGTIVPRVLWQVYPLLLLINTPRLVGRQTHDPHRGAARRIFADRKALGIFPLQAWTEITLAAGTIDISTETPKSTRLSGNMPLHWTRAHKRRIHGIWTLISDYWSGDGSLGIKQSRYKIVPAEQHQ